MNALQSYSSDDDHEDESLHQKTKAPNQDANYDDVGMDISEESGDESKSEKTVAKSNNTSEIPKESKGRENTTADDNLRTSSKNSTSSNDRSKSSPENSTSKKHQDDKDDRHGSSSKRDSHSREGHGNHSGRDSSNRDSHRHKDSRDKESRDNGSGRRDTKDYGRGGRDDDRRRDDRRSRRSGSRDRRRSRTRSRSRSRDRGYGSRRRSRDRDLGRDRKKPADARKEAQQKLSALQAKPLFDQAELIQRGFEAQRDEVQKQTGITLPTYYNPATMNPVKIAEQERKKKLLWGNKSKPVDTPVSAPVAAAAPAPAMSSKPAQLWSQAKFSNDYDGKMADKFKRLMGVKNAEGASTAGAPPSNTTRKPGTQDAIHDQESMFTSMERQYETARMATHTYKGFGLGFSSQSYLPK